MTQAHPALDDVVATWRERLRPSDTEEQALQQAVTDLTERAHAVARTFDQEGKPSFTPLLVGSAAKDTWLAGHVDLDLFLMFDPSVPRAQLESLGLEAGKSILPDWTLRYAEHPYVHGTFDGHEADVVPAYRVRTATEIQSAVDRTPFHNRWVLDRLDEAPEMRDAIRLLKAWLKGIGAYGAETQLAGVSGYLTEVLVLHHGGFRAALDALSTLRPGTRIDPTGASDARFPNDPLVIIDPVDPTRNAASAVRAPKLHLLQRAAESFLARPTDRYFDPAPIAPLAPTDAVKVLGDSGLAIITLRRPDMREDARVPHLRRAAQAIARQLEREGFTVTGTDAGEDEASERAWMALATDAALLPEERDQIGPPVGGGKREAGFLRKYRGHDDVLSGPEPRMIDGREVWAVRLRNEPRSLKDRVSRILDRRMSLGKHVDKALEAGPVSVLDVSEACADPLLQPEVSRLLCAVPPWARTGDAAHDFAR